MRDGTRLSRGRLTTICLQLTSTCLSCQGRSCWPVLLSSLLHILACLGSLVKPVLLRLGWQRMLIMMPSRTARRLGFYVFILDCPPCCTVLLHNLACLACLVKPVLLGLSYIMLGYPVLRLADLAAYLRLRGAAGLLPVLHDSYCIACWLACQPCLLLCLVDCLAVLRWVHHGSLRYSLQVILRSNPVFHTVTTDTIIR